MNLSVNLEKANRATVNINFNSSQVKDVESQLTEFDPF